MTFLEKNGAKRFIGFYLFWFLTFVYGYLGVFYLAFKWITKAILGRKQQSRQIQAASDTINELQPLCLYQGDQWNHRYIKIKGIKHHVVESGNPEFPLLLLVHGSPGLWFCWRKQIPILKDYFWVVAVDLKGCGDSERPSMLSYGNYSVHSLADDIVGIVHALGRSSTTLIVNESSGCFAWSLMQSRPEVVSKMILINSIAPEMFNETLHSSWSFYFKYWYLLLLQWPVLAKFLSAARGDQLMATFLSAQKNNNCLEEEDEAAYKYAFSRPGDWDGAIQLLSSNNFRPSLKKSNPDIYDDDVINIPTLFIIGANHPLLHLDAVYKSMDLIDGSKLKMVPGASTSIQVTHADVVNNSILEFLEVFKRRRNPRLRKSSTSPPPLKEASFVDRVFGAVTSPISTTSNVVSAAHKNISGGTANWLYASTLKIA